MVENKEKGKKTKEMKKKEKVLFIFIKFIFF